MTRARTGLEIDPTKIDRKQFWRNMQVLESIRRAGSVEEAQAQIVKYLADYCGLEGAESEVDVESEYTRFRSRITAAGRALEHYTHDMLPDDLLQRVSLTNEIAGATDPDQLIDMMLTVRDQRTRFEVRRLLHLGALFFEYEKLFGREADMQEYLHQLELYLDATLFTSGNMVDADLYHQVKDSQSGLVIASSIRLPQFDQSSARRQPGENHVKLSLRLVGQSNAFAVTQERLKDPFSAALKAIRERKSLADLKDIYGFTFFVNQTRDGRELQAMIEQLEQAFIVDPDDRSIHPIRRAEGLIPSDKDWNTNRALEYDVEKFFVDWNPATLLDRRSMVDTAVAKYYGTQRHRDRFWELVQRFSGKTQRVEMQAGTLRDYLTARLSGGDENHRVYKQRQASKAMAGDARSVIELLYPKTIYGIDFSDPSIIEVMRRKQLAGIGLHSAVLAQLDVTT